MATKKQARSAAGKTLSNEGASRGGDERAKRLAPDDRQRIARAGAFEKAGKLIRIRFLELTYDHAWHEIRGEKWCRCAFELQRSGEDPVSGHVDLIGIMLLRNAVGVADVSELPEWADRQMIEHAAKAFRRYIVDERIIPPPGMGTMFISGTLANSGRFTNERVYDFADTDEGWQVIGWR